MLRRWSLSATLAILTLLLVPSSDTRAQDLVGGAARMDLSGGASSSSTRPTRRTPRNAGSTIRNVLPPKIVRVTRTTGTLAVATSESGATIQVEPLKGGDTLQAAMEKNERGLSFGDLKPGRYIVSAELDGFKGAEKEVTIVANKSSDVTLDLTPITDSVTINANVPTGEVRYALVKPRTNEKGELVKDEKGEIKYDVIGETRVVQIQNGSATLPKLRPGTYGIDVRTEIIGYQDLLASFKLPGKTTHEITLEKNLSTKTYSDQWISLDAWEAPAGWRVGGQKLSVRGRGVALPKDDTVRHYADFHLFSSVHMLNGVAASFAVRALDAQNYYLIQVTGAKADEPYVLRGFIVRNGTAQRFGSTLSADSFAKTLKQDTFFSITIEATGNKFKVSITDSETGDVLPLGTLEDPNRNFPIGAAGIAVRDNEQNEIGRFVVCTSESPDCLKG